VHWYVPLLAAATLISAACGGAVFLHHRQHRGSQRAGLLLFGCGYWSASQLLACLAPDAAGADFWFRAGALGWVFIGPLALHVFMDALSDTRRSLRRVRGLLYAASAVLLALTFATDLVVRGVRPVAWGFWIEVGPVYALTHLNATIGVGLAAAISLRVVQQLSDAERRQLPWLAVAVAVPFVVSTVTDCLLPVAGIPFPPLATASLAFLSLLIVWVVVHYGYSVLTPGSFAAEILSLLPDGVVMLRPDQRIRAANQGLARLTERGVDELTGLQIGELLTWSFQSEEFDDVDCELLARSGRRVPVSVSASALRDRQGHVLGRVLVVRDLREVADLRRRLITSARLAAVGELAAGVAHEINNPLAFVRSNLSQFERLWKRVQGELDQAGRSEALRDVTGDIQELVADSLEGVDRAAEIVRGVRSFAHAGSEKRELADLNELLDDVVRVASPQFRGRVQVETRYAALPPIPCSAQQLRQVFLNLVLNASQAMPEGGRICLLTEAIDGGVAATVEDEGVGIPPEIVDRIFDPFFTTKPVGEGTGLGLGIAHQIVEQHRGTISVESTPGVGTRFRVTLPADDRAPTS
jgi:signal transduction histidine kinase